MSACCVCCVAWLVLRWPRPIPRFHVVLLLVAWLRDYSLPIFNKKKTNVTAVMDRSPYGQFALELIADIYAALGDFAAVKQDMRGTGWSQGNFSFWRSSANDSYDTMQWISEQSWSDGQVLTVGASADGLASLEEVIDKPKWLIGQFVIFASDEGHGVAFPGYAFREQLITHWLKDTVKDADYWIETIMSHEANGVWWHDLEGEYFDNVVHAPAVFWGGWYDIFLHGNLAAYYDWQYRSMEVAQGKSKLVIDPCGHCQDASHYFTKNLIYGRILLPILLSFDLFEDTTKFSEGAKDVTFYVLGTNDDNAAGNYWTSLDTWPEYTPQNWYFHTNGSLSLAPPTATDAPTYKYDPTNPVPTIGGNNLFGSCGPKDQTPVLDRPDVLVYTSDPLPEPYVITGPLWSTLYVASSANDTDFTVKLMVEDASGANILIQDGIIRMRWREHELEPTPMVPGDVYEVQVGLWNTSFAINTGNRIKVAISSSNYPRFSINPNNGLPLLAHGPNITAMNTLHLGPATPSHFTLPMVKLSQLPEFHALDAMSDRFGLDRPTMTTMIEGFVNKLERMEHLPPMRGTRN